MTLRHMSGRDVNTCVHTKVNPNALNIINFIDLDRGSSVLFILEFDLNRGVYQGPLAGRLATVQSEKPASPH